VFCVSDFEYGILPHAILYRWVVLVSATQGQGSGKEYLNVRSAIALSMSAKMFFSEKGEKERRKEEKKKRKKEKKKEEASTVEEVIRSLCHRVIGQRVRVSFRPLLFTAVVAGRQCRAWKGSPYRAACRERTQDAGASSSQRAVILRNKEHSRCLQQRGRRPPLLDEGSSCT